MGGVGRAPAFVLFLLGGLSSGCVEPQTDSDPASGLGAAVDGNPWAKGNLTFSTTLEEVLNATLGAPETSAQDWFLASMPTGPDRPLAGFVWQVPKGGVVPTNWDAQRTTVAVELVPVFPQGAQVTLTQFILQAFRVEQGKAIPLAEFSRGTWDEVYRFGPLRESYRYDYVGPEGSFWWLGTDRLRVGDRVYFVLAAESDQPSELGIAFRLLHHDPDWEVDVPPANFSAFQGNVTGRPPKALERLGTGMGFSFPIYLDVRSLYAFGYEGWSKDVVFRDALPVDLRPVATVRDFAMEFHLSATRGWGQGVGLYYGLGGVGQWNANVEIHGPERALQGTIAPALAGEVNPEFWYGSGYWITAEGEGPAHARFRVVAADASYVDLVILYHLDFAATLVDLIGVPGRNETEVYDPTTDSALRVALAGPQLRLETGEGASITLDGTGAALRPMLQGER